MVELHRMVATRPPEELAGVRALLAVPPIHAGTTSFEDQLTTVLVGIAARRDEDWRPIMERAASGAPPQEPGASTAYGGGNVSPPEPSSRVRRTEAAVGSQAAACTEIGSWL